ncbi:hypothetical protein J6590_063956 [Homalodisca vitripennis]|nr:hypothetical protein J6590_063956 [Homalodisca vitripennis]
MDTLAISKTPSDIHLNILSALFIANFALQFGSCYCVVSQTRHYTPFPHLVIRQSAPFDAVLNALSNQRLLCRTNSYSAEPTVILQNQQLLCRTHSYSAEPTVILQNQQLLCRTHSYSAEPTVTLQNPQLLCRTNSYSAEPTVTLQNPQLQFVASGLHVSNTDKGKKI